MKQNLIIAMICDNTYSMPTAVAITSIISNKNRETNLKIYLICDSLSEDNRARLLTLRSSECEIIIIDVNSKEYDGLEKSYSSVSKSALLKFSLPTFINEDKVLYLDGDVVVTTDITSFFNKDLKSKYAAVISDGPKPKKIPGGKKHLIYGEKKYFNSGVMLLNLDRMRKDNISQKLIDYRLHEYNYFMDQDAFNVVLGDNVIHLGVEYDFMLHLISFRNESFSMKQLIDFYRLKDYKVIDELLKNVLIFHYTFEKPWKYYDVPFNEIWMRYFYLSPYSDYNLNRSSYTTEEIYKSKTYTFSRKISKVIRTIFGIK